MSFLRLCSIIWYCCIIPLDEYSTIYLAFLLLMDIWVVSNIFKYNNAAMNFLYRSALKMSRIYNQG